MDVWRAAGISGSICLEAADSLGVFCIITGGSGSAFDLGCDLPQKNMDGTAVR